MEERRKRLVFDIIFTDRFKKDIEYYIKKKKFHHIDNDIENIIDNLQKGILLGDVIKGVKSNVNAFAYKIRANNSDTKSGKSNGYRLIYYAISKDYKIYLLTIYYKKDEKNIPTNKEIADLINKFCL